MIMKVRVHGFAGIAVAIILTVISSTNGFAWYYYAGGDDGVWEEISMERESLPVGTIITTLPNGARSIVIERTQYFISGENWFRPVSSEQGIRYQVVFAPV